MKNHKINLLATFLMLGLLLANSAGAAQVQSALAPNQVGITARQLMSTTLSTNIDLPSGAAKPLTMGNVVAGVHLGTNTDLFAVGTKTGTTVNSSEFWVRYTLDASSNGTHTYRSDDCCTFETKTNTAPITGALWISFNLSTQVFAAYTQQLSFFTPFRYWEDTRTFQRLDNAAAFTKLYGGESGYPDHISFPGSNTNMENVMQPCIECSYEGWLTLSFLELRMYGTRYELTTIGQGFDQIFRGEQTCKACGWHDTISLNIAPVPVPGALWLFGSGLAGIAALQRRHAARA